MPEEEDEAEAFVQRLVARHPILQSLLERHLEAFGELIPHPFMSDVARFLEQRFDTGDTAAVQPVLETIEAAWGHDSDIDNLTAVSFVEMLPGPNGTAVGVTELLGPHLYELAQQLH